MTTKPIYNLNGTDPRTMLDQYAAVLVQVEALRRAMAETTPHGRDYQTDATGSRYLAARDEHVRRCAKLDSIERDYRELAEHAHDAWAEREARKAAR